MNVSTSTSTSAMSGVSDMSSSQPASTSNSQKTSEKSFDAELKTAKTEENKDTKENEKNSNDKSQVSDSKNSKEKISHEEKESEDFVNSDVFNGEINISYYNESQSILSQNIQSLINTKDLMGLISSAPTIDYDTINMSDSDANFFANLVQNTDMRVIANQVNESLIENSPDIQKNLQVSSVLMEKLAQSLKTNQPFRIDFDKDVSVIIKVNKDGSLSANFIPGDKAAEQYLRNNIESLKNRFDEENLAYSELTYSNSRGNKKQRNKKENDNE